MKITIYCGSKKQFKLKVITTCQNLYLDDQPELERSELEWTLENAIKDNKDLNFWTNTQFFIDVIRLYVKNKRISHNDLKIIYFDERGNEYSLKIYPSGSIGDIPEDFNYENTISSEFLY